MKIAIEGPPGIGKTVLCKTLADRWSSVRLIHEPVLDNPYLQDFYNEPDRWGLTMEVHILLERIRYMGLALGDTKSTTTLMDRSIYGDWTLALAYAQLGYISEEEWRTYEKLFQQVTAELLIPDVIIYLDAPVEVLMERIASRGRKAEEGPSMGRPLLEEVTSMYREVMEDLHVSEEPPTRVIRLDWSEFPDDGGIEAIEGALRSLKEESF